MKKSPTKPRRKSRENPRFLMFAASSVWVALILVLFVFRGGGTTPVERHPPVEPPPLASGLSLVQQADELTTRGEYGAAAEKYQAAMEQDPDDISLRFALGTALSYVNRQADTVEQFRWVVARGNSDSLEVQAARRWLVSAGVLAGRVTFASPEEVFVPGAVPVGKVKGRTEGRGVDREAGPHRVSIVLRGQDESNKEVALDTLVRLGEPYEFDGVPSGNYLLTARLSETKLWEQKVTVEPGGETVLDLTSASGVVTANEHPGPARKER